MRKGLNVNLDLALHDLMGVILDKSAYKLIGDNGSKDTPIYSGMIYFDELEHEGKLGGIDKILENCQWDIVYGYRQLKVKIGRSGKWYSHKEGIKMDIEVVKQINSAFPNTTLLVDSNDKLSEFLSTVSLSTDFDIENEDFLHSKDLIYP